MNARRALLVPLISLLSVTAWSGCGAGKAYDIGRNAEKRGDAHLAHDYYVRAGTKRPGNNAIREGLKRTAPSAVEFWRDQAKVATQQGRYDDAWRMLMRALKILPNDARTLAEIRRLEAQHGLAVASAKADYLQRGTPALEVQLARLDDTSQQSTAQALTELVSASPEATSETSNVKSNEPTLPIAQTFAGNTDGALACNRNDVTPAEPVQDDTAAASSTGDPFKLRFADSTEEPDEPPDRLKPRLPDAPLDTIRPEQQKKPTQPAAALKKKASSGDNPSPSEPGRTAASIVDAPVLTDREYRQALKERQTAKEPRREAESFAVVRTFSRKNSRFPKQALLIDGVSVKLKDTDDEFDADLNLYIDGKRVEKIRDLPIGRAKAFKGRSGKTYLLTILSIHHNSHTVRLGVNPQ